MLVFYLLASLIASNLLWMFLQYWQWQATCEARRQRDDAYQQLDAERFRAYYFSRLNPKVVDRLTN